MSQDELYTAMNQIEDYIDQCFTLFCSYRLVKKASLYNKFKLLYDSLPQELIDNKDYFNSQQEENIFTLLNKMSVMLEQSKTFLGYMVVNANTILRTLDEMYASLPDDLKRWRENGNVITDTAEIIEKHLSEF